MLTTCNNNPSIGSAHIPTPQLESKGGIYLTESRFRQLLKLAHVRKRFFGEIARSAILLYATYLRHRAKYARVFPIEEVLLKELSWFREEYCPSIEWRVVLAQSALSRRYMGRLKDETIYRWLDVDPQEREMLDAVRLRKPKAHKEKNQRQLKVDRVKLVEQYLRERGGATISELRAHLKVIGHTVSLATVARYREAALSVR